MTNDSFVVIRSPASAEFAALLVIYEEALPAAERKDRTAVTAMLFRSDYQVLGLQRHGQTIGLAILFKPDNQPLALLEYMAVDRRFRGNGLGAQLFMAAARQVADRTLLLEVESDLEKGPDQALRARRKRFYVRLGCRVCDRVDYIMPQLGAEKPPPMQLLVYGHDGDSIARDQLKAWLGTIYVEVYGRSSDDPAIAAMIARTREEIVLTA